MITCDECGKINGAGESGTSWICEDCKVSGNDVRILPESPNQPETDDPDGKN